MNRKEAIIKGEKYYKGNPCKKGHSGKRYVSNGGCIECEYLRISKRAEDGYFIEYEKKRCQDPKRKAWKRKWCKSEKGVKSRRNWESNNRPLTRHKSMKRYTKLKHATPPWVFGSVYEEEIEAIYEEAVRIEMCTGLRCHVDHIIPIQGENVSGLHVPWNLCILEASENIAKSNKVLEELF